jgi:glycosyltransferase involved in cell wall biosynthesis
MIVAPLKKALRKQLTSKVNHMIEKSPPKEIDQTIRDDGVFCSFIIPTIGRSTLERSVMSVLEQDFQDADFEVIVVNDSGRTLQKADWHESHRVRIINTFNRERSFARNIGAATAKGKYLWFLDDDDWILPGATSILYRLTLTYPKAGWLYGGLQIVNEKDEILADLNSELSGNCFAQIMGGAWVPIQSSIVSTKVFFQLGGFNPHILVTEDLDLCRRFSYVSEFATTRETVACLLRGESWSTSSNYNKATENTKKSRDCVLSESAAFTRLMSSARTPYWFGRILRVYLSTINWNIRQFHLFTAMSRFIYTCLVLFKSNRHLLSREFWAGMKADHVPGTLHYVMQAYERELAIKPRE